jgi:sulfotransferase
MGLKPKKQFALFSGLPRTGSTLLTNILAQNPQIHAEGASLLCQLMWNVQETCRNYPALAANNRVSTEADLLGAIPDIFYQRTDKPIVIDKCRTWVHPANVDMWTRNVHKDQKFVVMVRPIQDVVRSFVSLRLENDWQGDLYSDILVPGSEPISRAAQAIFYAKQLPQDNFLYVDYRDLTDRTLEVINIIYDFFGWRPFEHSLGKIEQLHREDDTAHGLLGMHDIREKISVRKIDIDLPPYVEAFCEELNQMIYSHKVDGEWSMIEAAV